MIAERFTFQVKPGKWDKAVKLAKEGKKNVWPFISSRIYTVWFGPMQTIVFELEFKDMADHDKKWEKLNAKKKWGTWVAKWQELIAVHGTHEIWGLD